MPALDTTTLLYYLAAAAMGWLLRHWGVLAPGTSTTPLPMPVPTPTTVIPANVWNKLKEDAETAIATALQQAFASAVSTIQPQLLSKLSANSSPQPTK